MKQKTAFITGITGQDGFYLANFLLNKGYHVIGFVQGSAASRIKAASTLPAGIDLVYGDLSDSVSLMNILLRYKPAELYNFAAQSSPGDSWDLAIRTGEVTALGAHRLFEAVRQVHPTCRIYQASSSDMFGDVIETPQTESTPFNPVNPYAVAKIYAHQMVKVYRKSYGMYISCGILFNHESPRRGMNFISQKVTYGAACIKLDIQNSSLLNEQGEPIVKNGKLLLGNLDATRDWGYAGDYVEAMWLMLQQPHPDDFVIGTGQARTIRQLCEEAFSCVGLNWQDHVEVDTRFVRPTETGSTIANSNKAKKILGWEPRTSFSQLIQQMVQHHIENLTRG